MSMEERKCNRENDPNDTNDGDERRMNTFLKSRPDADIHRTAIRFVNTTKNCKNV